MNSSQLWSTSWRAIPATAALIFLLTDAASAQSPAPQPTPPGASPQTTIRAATRLVTLQVIVQDKKGQPVAGLRKDDFELFDNDRPQEIKVFSVEGSLAASASKAAPPPLTLPAGIYTNSTATSPAVPTSATVIVLDGINTSASELSMARVQLGKFLAKLQPGDLVALYTMGRELKMVHDFTSDSAALVQALNGVPPETTGGPHLSSLTAPDPRLDPASSDFKESLLLNLPNADMHIRDFRAMGEHLAGLPGRKTLIWISRGFPLMVEVSAGPGNTPDFVDMTPKVREVSQVLSKYNVAVYPMDTRGVLVGIGDIDGPMYDSNPMTPMVAMSNSKKVQDMENAHDSGRLLAQLTGGRTYYDQNELDYGLRSAMDDSKLVYTLGYYPAQDNWDSQFHTFKVRVNQPGLKLTYRSGYMASPEQQSLSADDEHQMLDKAVLDPLDSTAITLFARLKHEGTTGDSLTIDMLVDVKDLTLEHEGGRWKGNLVVVVAQLASAGAIFGDANGARQHSVTLDLPDADYARMRTKGLELFFPLAPEPQAVKARVVVRDETSGAVGTVSIPLNKTT